ncbi:D-2-hydroxyacid dehydrogenase [Dyadobacter chenwenxiniae]|uniref:D-2-hydroxyacid dehydrogenase n=1 Tax=Dyadobacter chenwenxiniae TaxID=2906456 RepID=A0A9X1PI09_9BACT|nr:D-2-hydroxyacid dehydrogenase [Dyadobacter chenwenxiniae]MCF0061717.1 D-2-hydroxyacid dehydrogenase [Dyadobacter chenwenxiniae]UON81535.1 D-2-hydroxyacid dehydrogenase [Dyadobacter chenwenxiniae]
MNIVILDGYTLNPGDLDWAPIQEFGNVTIYDRSASEEIVTRAKDAEVLLVNKVVLTEAILDELPKVKYIGIMATGFNNIDINAARKHNITVTNVKAYGPASVAQQTFALLLAVVNHAELHSQSVFAGDWVASPDFCYWKTPLTELAGKTMGLIGLGDIGSQVAKIALAFGMKVIAYRKHPMPTAGIEMVSLEDVFEKSDVISLHCPLTDETKEIVNKERLARMRRNAIILNTGRGPLIQENDLAEALKNGIIAGAGLDVLSTEPPKADNPLLSASNCIITPHVAWATFEARKRLLQMVADNLESFMNGEAKNVVS